MSVRNRIPPNIPDPSMRKNRPVVDIEQVDDDVMDDGDKPETNEEGSTNNTNTILIVVFALVVIALIAMIVWMVMKQGNDTKDEREVRQMVQPNPHMRNGMPPPTYQVHPSQMHPVQMHPAQHHPVQHHANPAETHQLQNVAAKMNQINAELQPETKKAPKPAKKTKKTKQPEPALEPIVEVPNSEEDVEDADTATKTVPSSETVKTGA